MPTLTQRNARGKQRKAQSASANPQLPPQFNRLLKWMGKTYDWLGQFSPSELLFNSNKNAFVAYILLPIELLLNLIIVYKIPYTEIDWKAYMQEVEGFVNGTFDYYELKGDTGPLVYPAGFVYIYTLLYGLTKRGIDLKLAQFIFIALYLVFMSLVFLIYKKTKRVQPIALIFMCLTSHRIHSIFVLRLFNDPIAMLFLYAAIVCLLNKFWRAGCILFSLAVSIKMNILLFAPGLFIILMLSHGFVGTIKYIFLCGVVQLILGAPFLLTYPVAYIHRSFDFGRQFFYIWTVNWKFLPEETFLDRRFHLTLLFLHLFVLVCFMNKCLKNFGGLKSLFSHKKQLKLSSDFIILVMFLSNFIGICFSRSLHYQFYVWYYHTLAYLLWSTKLPNSIKLLIYGVIELCWNIFPSNMYNSLALNACHLTILASLWRALSDDTLVKAGADKPE